MTRISNEIRLQEPFSSTSLDALSVREFPFDRFLTTWFVVASTLPMWKGKKNITITYSPIEGQPKEVFSDLIEYHSDLSASPSSPRKQIRGIDRPDWPESSSQDQVRWKWRGKGLLKIASSRWQPMGFHFDSASEAHYSDEPDWVITYFEKTLFTPAGIDIYAQTSAGIAEDLKQRLIKAVRQSVFPSISKLADQLFDTPHDIDIQNKNHIDIPNSFSPMTCTIFSPPVTDSKLKSKKRL
ncbi:hypothetical protein CROQUDRAFT_106965 [Cronartium quercuum f. sp. fusiforme G11]|uniref:Uncharacterized protein n=1 Tax=Cronartium quercuum f. sp. fusiforme G11 TaxID=708437 RepID=A0A9P6NIM1_9BASI|nr:hypothetical protein CROQUDRAFT_106965 [Cronartium quercuum f. sp. fusiforme G11]